MGEEKANMDRYVETGDMCYTGEVKTPFATAETIDSMKEMLSVAKPDEVLDVADAWERIDRKIASGDGSIKSDFDKAVDHVLQHWEGEAAEQFAQRAKNVSKQLSNCATYARYTGTAMKNAGNRLAEIKPEVMAIEKPGTLDKAGDALGDAFGRNEDWLKEMKDNQGAQSALENHDGNLSAGKEAQLQAAAKMESLALNYTAQAQTMGSWRKAPPPRVRDDNSDYPGEPGGVAPVPVPVGPGGPGATGGSAAPSARTGTGSARNGGNTKSPMLSKTPGAGTKVAGISGGTANSFSSGGTVNPTGTSGAMGSGSSSGLGGGFAGAAGGTASAGRAGGPGMVGKASGNRGMGGEAAKGAAARSAGSSMRGGIGSGSGAGKGSGASTGGRGPLARQKGGKLDTPEAGKGTAKQGGSGLHSSRGGSAAGQRGRAGMLGGAGKNNDRRKGDNQEGKRPDYLIEDEETWMPKRRDVTPPTIG